MTKSFVSKSKTTTGGVRKKKNYLSKWIRRKTCIICFIINIVIFLVAIVGIGAITYAFISTKSLIKETEDRKAALQSRSHFDAFYQSGICKIYPDYINKNNLESDYTFCNRYCEANNYMEFISRVIDQQSQKKIQWQGNELGCPIYVELRHCQKKTSSGSHCNRKRFNKDYQSSMYANDTMGICTACSSTPTSEDKHNNE